MVHSPDQGYHLIYKTTNAHSTIIRIAQETQPDEIYNLAAQSYEQVSLEMANYTAKALGSLRWRRLKLISNTCCS